MLASSEPKQSQAEQRAPCQIEAHLRIGRDPLPGLPFALCVALQIEQGQGDLQLGRDDLLQTPVRVRREGGAQRFMTLHDGVQAAPELRDVELAGEAHRYRHAVGGAASAPGLEEPHPLLGEGGESKLHRARPASQQPGELGAPLVGLERGAHARARRRIRSILVSHPALRGKGEGPSTAQFTRPPLDEMRACTARRDRTMLIADRLAGACPFGDRPLCFEGPLYALRIDIADSTCSSGAPCAADI
jgi:hypothetical protein